VQRAACMVFFLLLGSVEKLIEQLSRRDPKTRDAARKALEKLGPEALPVLRKALTHPDLEVRKRIAEIVPALETSILVAPKLVTLKVEKKSARQLLEELSKQTGYKMDIWNDDPREVYTLDLDKVPFWKAVDEIGRLSNMGPLNGYGDDRLRFQKEPGAPSHVFHDGSFRFVPQSFQYNRSLTFRRLGEAAKLADRSETLTLAFTLHAEPKLPLLGVGEAQVSEAIDNEGHSLLPPPPAPENDQPGMIRRTAARYGNGYASTSVQGNLSLGRPSDRARGVKLLRAAIPVTLLADQKPEVVVENVLEAKKKKVSIGSTTFNIESCELTPEKQYRLKMGVTEANLGANDYTWMNTLYRRVELLDEKGNKFQVQGSGWSHSDPGHVQVTFNYGSGGATVGPPRKMTYQVWKTLSYQVRVELRDVPLP
jgi:hypothetical protein